MDIILLRVDTKEKEMINKISNSPSFKCDVNILYNKDASPEIKNKFYQDQRFYNAVQKLKNNYDDYTVTLYDVENYGDNYMMMHISYEDRNGNKCCNSNLVDSPKNLMAVYEQTTKRLTPIPKSEPLFYDMA